jgi:hypothetical protein
MAPAYSIARPEPDEMYVLHMSYTFHMILIRTLCSSLANQRNSLLLRLHAELRNRIYDLVYDDTKIRVSQPASTSLGLLHSCRQIRHDASRMFFTRATFALDSFFDVDNLLYRFGAERCRMITTVELSKILTLRCETGHKKGIRFRDLGWLPGLKGAYVVDRWVLFGDRTAKRERTVAAVRDCFHNKLLDVIFER